MNMSKLTSRKFWVAVASIVSGLVMMFGIGESTAEIIAGAIVTIGGAVGYMIAEGVVDAKKVTFVLDEFMQALEDIEEVENKGE